VFHLRSNVVPIPGESAWVSAASKKIELQSGQTIPPVPSLVGPVTTAAATSAASTGSAKKKRPLSDDAEAEASMDTSESHESSSSATGAVETKKGRGETAAAAAAASVVTGAQDHGLEVIVTLYDGLATGDGRNPKVTQCFEFIGVLALNPDLAAELEADGFDIGNEGWNPRRRRAVRIHALAAIPIAAGFPFIADPKVEAQLFDTQKSELRQVLAGVRSSLVEFLKSLLGGDELAAEVLLLFLLQRVHQRGIGLAGTNMVGKLALNFIAPSVPDGTTPHLANKIQQVFELLLPRTRKIDMNIEELNKQVWQPKKSQWRGA
jgi:hypothetical protein